MNAWWSIVFYPATDVPRFKKGMIAMICVSVATLVITWLVYFLERREWRGRDSSEAAQTKELKRDNNDYSRSPVIPSSKEKMQEKVD